MFLLPGMLFGLWIARNHAAPLGGPLLIAAIFLGFSLWFNQRRNHSAAWALCFFVGSTLLFWAYGTVRFPTHRNAANLAMPEREAILKIDVERVFGEMTIYRNSSGIGTIREASQTSPLQTKSRIYFRVRIPEESDYRLRRGQKLQLKGVLYPIAADVSNDSFEGYLKSIGIDYTFERSSELELLKRAPWLDRFCMHMNDRFDEYLRLGVPADTRITNIYVAMLLGKKAALTDEQNERFRMTGTMHFFAISGLHIGVIATMIAQCLLVIRVPRRYSPWIGLPLLYLYVEITGASPSAVRAFLMTACFWLSFAIVRQRSPLGALAASAVAVLILAPEQLWSLGFQLSYTVVLSILLFGLPLYERLFNSYSPFQWLPKDNWSVWQRAVHWSFDKCLLVFSISFSAWLASAPLSAEMSGFIAPSAVLINMLLVNLAALVIIGGVIGLSLAAAGLGLVASFTNHSAWVCLSLMDWFVTLSLAIPGSVIVCENFPRALSYFGVVGYSAILFWLNADPERFQNRTVWTAPIYICTILITGVLLGN